MSTTKDKVRQIIAGVRDLLSDPARHTTGTAARDKSGNETDCTGPYAVCWCFIGALGKASRDAGVGVCSPEAFGADAEIKQTLQELYADGPFTLVGVNEDGTEIRAEDGSEITGLPAILRLCDVTLERLAA